MRIFRHALVRVMVALVFAGCTADAPRAPKAPGEPPAPTRVASSVGPDAQTENSVTRTADPSVASNREDGAAAPPITATPPLALADLPIADEPIYFPGGRARPKRSAVEASLDDEIVATWNRGGLVAEPSEGSKPKAPHAAPR